MSDDYDHVPTYNSEGDLRNYATPDPDFEAVSNELRPDVGDVQAALDTAGAQPSHPVVRLRSDTDYSDDPDLPWQVRRGVLLDFNGAWIDDPTDTELLHIYPRATVWNAELNGYNSDGARSAPLVRFDTAFDGTYQIDDGTRFIGGRVAAPVGEGTLFDITESQGDAITGVTVDTSTYGGNKIFDFDAQDGNTGFINQNRWGGCFRKWGGTAIDMHGVGDVWYNQFKGAWFSGSADWLWQVRGDACSKNLFFGHPGEQDAYTNGTFWEIQNVSAHENTVVSMLPVDPTSVVDNSTKSSNDLIVLPESGKFHNVAQGKTGGVEIESGAMALMFGGTKSARVWPDAFDFLGSTVNFNGAQIKGPQNTTTSDGMTADPESQTEDGYLTIDIGGTAYQVPIYQA